MTQDHNTIVVGVDGEEDSARAAQWAAGWAQQLGMSLKIVSADRTTGDKAALEEKLASIGAEAKAAVQATHPEVEVAVNTSIDNPVSVMLDESETAAAVVIGTRGTGGWRGTGMGSVAGSVAAASKCPTVVVPPGASGYDATGDLVVGHDGTDAATRITEETIQRAAKHGRKVRVVQAGSDAMHHAVEGVVEDMRAKYPDMTIEFVHGDEDAETLLARESESAAALIVATRGHRGVPGFLPGPTTLFLLQHAKSPVLVHSETNERETPN